jgi:uncharacterized membrane protein
MERTGFVLVFAAAIGSGLIAGIFYAFSSFVMPALARLPAEQGAAAMKSINITVITPSFMIVFVGTALVCLVLAGGSLLWWSGMRAGLVLAASLLYVVGCFGVTMVFNVPLNDQLEAVAPAQAADLWARYLEVWTMWNHVRTAAPLLGTMLFIAALALR